MHRKSLHSGRLTCRVPRNQRGMALVIVLVITVGLTSLGVASYLMSASRHGRVVAVKKDVAGVAKADAGIEEARYRLNSAIPGYLTEATPTTTWGYYIKPPSGSAVSSGSAVAEAVDSAFKGGYTQVASATNHSDFHWVKIRHKTENDAIPGEYVDGDGNPSSGQIIYYGYYGANTSPTQFSLGAWATASTSHKPVKVAVSYGAEKAGVSAELAYSPGVPVPAPLYAKDVVTANGATPSVDGNDEVGMEAALPPVVTMATFVDNAPSTMTPDPPGVVENSPLNIDIDEMIEMLYPDATILTDDADDDQPVIETSTAADPGIFYIEETTVPGITYNNMTGYGVLMVEGDLALGGGFNWYGIILVTGDIELNGGGGPNAINIHGAVLAGEQATINGNVDFYFNSNWANELPFNGSPKVIKWKEI